MKRLLIILLLCMIPTVSALGTYGTGDVVYFSAQFNDENGTRLAATNPRALVYDPDDVTAKQSIELSEVDGTLLPGYYRSSYTVPASPLVGEWSIIINGSVSGSTTEIPATVITFQVVATDLGDLNTSITDTTSAIRTTQSTITTNQDTINANLLAFRSESKDNFTETNETQTQVKGTVDDILADTDNLQTNQGAWATAAGFSTHSAADVWTTGSRELSTPADYKATGFSTHSAANVWSSGTRTLSAFGFEVGLMDNSINTSTFKDDTITAAKIAASAIGASEIAANAIGISEYNAQADVWGYSSRTLTANTNASTSHLLTKAEAQANYTLLNTSITDRAGVIDTAIGTVKSVVDTISGYVDDVGSGGIGTVFDTLQYFRSESKANFTAIESHGDATWTGAGASNASTEWLNESLTARFNHVDSDLDTVQTDLDTPNQYKATVSSLSTQTDVNNARDNVKENTTEGFSDIETYGDGSWTTATGFASTSDVTNARDNIKENVSEEFSDIETYGDANWLTATGFTTSCKQGENVSLSTVTTNQDTINTNIATVGEGIKSNFTEANNTRTDIIGLLQGLNDITAQNVWDVGTRTLSAFGFSDNVRDAVWSHVLTTGFSANETMNYILNNATTDAAVDYEVLSDNVWNYTGDYGRYIWGMEG